MEIDWGRNLDLPLRPTKVRRHQFKKTNLNKSKVDWPWKQIILEVVLLTLILVGFWYGALFLTQSPELTINEVRFEGTKTLANERLVNRLGPIIGKNILTADLLEMAKRLEKHPWIRDVSVERKLPNAIQFQIIERTPMVRIILDKVFVMDNFGAILEESSPEFENLPIVSGVDSLSGKPGQIIPQNKLAPSLQMMHYLNQLSFFQSDPIIAVKILKENQALFTSRDRRIRIRANLEEIEEGFEKLKILLSLSGEAPNVRETIDLLFRNQVVVKPAPKGNGKVSVPS